MIQEINCKRISEIGVVKYRENYNEEYSYVLCIEYGTNGLIPTLLDCDGGCMSSSGDSCCGGYLGDEKIPNTNLHVVRCANNLEDCIMWHRKNQGDSSEDTIYSV